MPMISDKTLEFIRKKDSALNKLAGWNANDLINHAEKLTEYGNVEVGYRSCCGSTDRTHKIYRMWIMVLKRLRKDGFNIKETVQKHDNAYATSNGGFWNSNVFEIE